MCLTTYLLKATIPPQPTFPTKAISVAKDELLKYEGRYRWLAPVDWQSHVQSRKFSDFFVQDGVLKAKIVADYPVINLVPVGKDVFIFQQGPNVAQFTFGRSAEGAITDLEVKYNNGYPAPKMVFGLPIKSGRSEATPSRFGSELS